MLSFFRFGCHACLLKRAAQSMGSGVLTTLDPGLLQLFRYLSRLPQLWRPERESFIPRHLLLDGEWQLQGRRLLRPQIVKPVIQKIIAGRGVAKVQSQMDHELAVSMPALQRHFPETVLFDHNLPSRRLDD